MEVDSKLVLVKIWDTAGQEKFAAVTKGYYQRAHGMIVTCAVDSRKTFNNLRNWIYSIRENNINDNLPIVLVGNKCDLTENREIKQEELVCLAKEWGVECYETSAKEGTNVDEAFDYIINKIYKTLYKKIDGIKLEEQKEEGGVGGKINNCCK